MVSLSHVGTGDVPEYLLNPNNGFICQKGACEESPFALMVGQDWLKYVMKIVPRGGMVLYLYGTDGKGLMYVQDLIQVL